MGNVKIVIPEKFDAELKITVYGKNYTVPVTYYNRSVAELSAEVEKEGFTAARGALFLVADIGLDMPLTEEGVEAMEAQFPGLCLAIIQNFNEAKMVTRQKNF